MRAIRSACLIGVAFALGCGTSPVAPTPAATTPPSATIPIVAGTWTGSYLPVCPDSPRCGWIGAGPVDEQDFVLVLRQDGATLSGQITLNDWWMKRMALVTGEVKLDGSMTLQGGDSWDRDDFCRPAGGWNIVSWNGRYDRATDSIAGDFSFVTQKHLSSCYYDQDLNVNATRMSLRHGAGANTTLDGHWQGAYAIARCTSVGSLACAQGENIPLELRLSQSGTSITGTVTQIPAAIVVPMSVSGTATNTSISSLSGTYLDVVSLGMRTVRVTKWSTTIDPTGELQGTFTYVDEIRWTAGPNAGTTWSNTYDAELRFVIRLPS